MTRRRGAVSLSELVLVFWIFALVLLALTDFVAGQGRLVRHQEGLVRLQEARRSIEIILGRELRTLAPADVDLRSPRELALRAVRGSGPVCGVFDRHIAVEYAGARDPDPDKDSLLLAGDTGEEVFLVEGVAGSGCAGGGVTLILDRPPSLRSGFALVFERGSYHAADAAVRYRIGRGGRQPLTEAFFADAELEPAPPSGLRLTLLPDADSLPPALVRPIRLWIPSLNGPER